MGLTKTNNLLLCLIILVNFYVVITPVVPALLFAVQSHTGRQAKLVQRLHPTAATQHAGTSKPVVAQANQLIIPAMLLNQPVLEGTNTYAVLHKGILHWPGSSTPDKGGNTVLLGHRFTYSNPRGAFYYLDKLQIGDEIGLTWNSKQYIYKVTSSRIIAPTETSIQEKTPDARLTLYTCTPLLWPKDRLVIVAELQTNEETSKP